MRLSIGGNILLVAFFVLFLSHIWFITHTGCPVESAGCDGPYAMNVGGISLNEGALLYFGILLLVCISLTSGIVGYIQSSRPTTTDAIRNMYVSIFAFIYILGSLLYKIIMTALGYYS